MTERKTIYLDDAIDAVINLWADKPFGQPALIEIKECIENLPFAEIEEFEWCHDCKEYDQEAHCCHRWTKVIRNTVEELKAEQRKGEWIETSEGTMCSNCHKYPYDDGEYHIANWHSDYCPNCGADMRGEEDDS